MFKDAFHLLISTYKLAQCKMFITSSTRGRHYTTGAPGMFCVVTDASGWIYNWLYAQLHYFLNLFPVWHYWTNWLIQVCLTSVVTTTIIRHTWNNQVCPIMADRKQGAGWSSWSSAAVHKANWEL